MGQGGAVLAFQLLPACDHLLWVVAQRRSRQPQRSLALASCPSATVSQVEADAEDLKQSKEFLEECKQKVGGCQKSSCRKASRAESGWVGG